MNNLCDLFLLRRDVVFLNHGSFGACPKPVFEAYQRWQLELEREPVEFLGRRFRELMASSRAALGRFVNARPEDLVFVPNATTGVNIVAWSLPLEPGDEVLSTNHEYGAMDRTFRAVCQRRGAAYVRQPVPLPCASHAEMADTVLAGVTSRTRVLFFSHIASPTAVIFPAAELARRCRERGIITVVDGAHAPGQIEVDLAAIGADFYAANCHKWLMAPKGSAFLHARPKMQPMLEPRIVSWGNDGDSPAATPFLGEMEWQGTRDPAAYLAVPAAIRFQEEQGWEAVRRSCRSLVCRARREVAALTCLPPLTPDSPDWFMQMASLPIPECDGPRLQQELMRRFSVEVPIIAWEGRRFARISVQGYNSGEDVDRMVSALAALIPRDL